jgi:hypothetical protein
MVAEGQSDQSELLLRDLALIDHLVSQAVSRLRTHNPRSPEEFQGLYVSDVEADAILSGRYPIGPGFPASPRPDVDGSFAVGSADVAVQSPRLRALVERAGLSGFDVAALLLALAPELDLKYERLFGYLHDDITRRRPSVDLALNLLCPTAEAKLAARWRFAAEAPLLRFRLLRLAADPTDHEPPLLRRAVIVEERVLCFLLGDDEPDERLRPWTRHIPVSAAVDAPLLPADLLSRLSRAVERDHAGGGPLIYLQGPYGVGKRTVATALCREAGLGLLVIDGALLPARELLGFEQLVRLALREASLLGAALYWAGFDALLADERRAEREALLTLLAAWRGPGFLAGEAAWEPAGDLAGLPFARVELPLPSAAERARLWERTLGAGVQAIGQDEVRQIAGAFRLSGGQIRDAAATAARLAQARDTARPALTADDLAAACRAHSNQRLANLARRVSPRRRWDDLVLPDDRVAQLRELCDAARQRARVYDDWGFARRLSLGKGLSALFAGPPGTGKTLAAEIIAGALGLELYTIDLATVVSKYIGETEKNLSRIFDEAEMSNAVLFFDEADALFGRRSEVKDAHDRYANLEIAYLLQRLEAYEGLVILASNLRKNIDEAFVRRLRFIVEFPFPAEAERRRIWEGVWPVETPRDPALDPTALARRFELAGGSISNIALAAAYLAAANGQIVTMEHLLHATRREYQKLGKLPGAGEFGV